MKQQFVLTAQFWGVDLWPVKSASPLTRCGGPVLRLSLSCGGVDRGGDTAGLDCYEKPLLKLENDQPLFLLVKPRQIPPI